MTGPASTPVKRFMSSSMTTWFMLSPVKVTPLSLPAQPHRSSQPQFQRYSVQRWTDRVRDVNSAGRPTLLCSARARLLSADTRAEVNLTHSSWCSPACLTLGWSSSASDTTQLSAAPLKNRWLQQYLRNQGRHHRNKPSLPFFSFFPLRFTGIFTFLMET